MDTYDIIAEALLIVARCEAEQQEEEVVVIEIEVPLKPEDIDYEEIGDPREKWSM